MEEDFDVGKGLGLRYRRYEEEVFCKIDFFLYRYDSKVFRSFGDM